ncbi:GerAB/ArcD/ProY family transporter [Peribacillus asahii]|uniref:GerAB/ArcD/ProY family transporter n=1 Tax=Peribacillus asahii TaxID=228899 RepID=UPI00207AAE23|nr:endospore germination permease [Peribacillus asahii]USK85841.1 endospore germination permease [Peribacillus asahii]
MLNNEKISVRQFRVLVTLFTIGTIAPVAEAKRDAWIAVIFSAGLGLLVIWLLNTIALLFPTMNFVQIIETLFGKWLGKAISLFFLSLPFVYTAEMLYYSGNFLNTHLLPDTPVEVLYILTAIIVVMAVRHGLETFSRTAELSFIAFMILFLLLLFISPQIKFENIQPVLEDGINPLLHPTIQLLALFAFNAVILLMIFPSAVNQPKEAQKSFFIGNLMGISIILIMTILSILVLDPYQIERRLYPNYAMVKMINIGNFLQRIEVVIATMWIITVYCKTVLYFYATCLGIAQVLNLKDYRPLTLPLGMIIVTFASMLFPNVIEQRYWDSEIGFVFSLVIGGLLPLFMLGVAIFPKKRT